MAGELAGRVVTVTGMVAEFAPRLSYELEGITTRGEFLRAAAESVSVLLPADSLGWVAVDMPAGNAEIHGTGDSGRPEVVRALTRVARAHPMLLSYGEHPGDMSPRRMSDLIPLSEWQSHQVYAEVFQPLLGTTHQVSITITPLLEGTWEGWGFNRACRDFTDDEMVTAARLQPVLMALNHASVRAFGRAHPGLPSPQQAETAERIGLTPRETRVLELLATGLTADAIGHICRISPRTVRKHLQNIYAKLDCHDRLMAVRRAAELGLAWQ